MDSLASAFSAQAGVSSEPNSIHKAHPRLANYKAKPGHVPDQEQRRLKMLEEQKSRRLDFSNHARQLAEVDSEESTEIEEVQPSDYEMKDTHVTNKKRLGPYKDQLMLSEWLVDIPADFSTQWLIVICPVGRRCLVIASRGLTSVYTKSGHCVNKFPSAFPGGSRKTGGKVTDYCILDCIYHEPTRTYYVLDVMCWRGHPVYDSETEFRFYWAQTKLTEQEAVTEYSRSNPFRFLPLDYYGCSQDQLVEVLTSEKPFEVDGLLFFHQQTHYTPGTTPLVTWLTPQLVPEVLGITVSEKFLLSKYPEVELPMETITRETAKPKKKGRHSSKKRQTGMETDTVGSQENSDMDTHIQDN